MVFLSTINFGWFHVLPLKSLNVPLNQFWENHGSNQPWRHKRDPNEAHGYHVGSEFTHFQSNRDLV